MLSEPLVKLNSVYVKVQEALLHLRGNLLVGDTGVVGKAVGGTARIFDAPAFYAQQVRQILRKYGSDAHLYMPGPGVPILGPELVVNGDFGNGTTGWQVGAGATIANVSGSLQITNTGTNGWATNQANIAVAVGKTYRYSFTNKGATQITFYIRDGVGSNPDMVGLTVNPGETKSGTFGSNTTGLNFRVFCIGAAGLVASVDDISVKEILGYTNYLNGFAAGNYLESTGNTNASVDGAVGLVLDAAGSVGAELVVPFDASWGKTGSATAIGGIGTIPANDQLYMYGKTVAGKKYILEWTATVSTGSGAVYEQYGMNALLGSLGEIGKNRVIFTAQTTGGGVQFASFGGTAVLSEVSLKEVTGIHASQATTANKPILRKSGNAYAWQFDGSNDVLALPGPLFQMSDDHCVVAAAKADSAAVYRCIASPSAFDGNSVACQMMVEATSGKAYVEWKGSGNTSTFSTAASVVGNVFVISGRKIGASKIGRVNGADLGAPQSANTSATAATAGYIGRSATGDFFAGSIYPIVAIKGTVSDADLRVLEKWLGSIAGVSIA